MQNILSFFFRPLLLSVFLSFAMASSAWDAGHAMGVVQQEDADDEFETLWDEVYQNARVDLPRSQRQVLQRIMEKARKEKNYGQLLSAQLMDASLAVSLSPDSFEVVVSRIKQEEQLATPVDTALAAVYRTVLSRLLQVRNYDSEGASLYARSAVEHPEVLASASALAWQPFMERGSDGSIFDDNLLSLVGFATGNAEKVHEYYMGTDNRKAQLVSAYMMMGAEGKNSRRKNHEDEIRRLDSLMTCYADLPECCELAIQRLREMKDADYTPRQQVEFIDEAMQKWGEWKNAVALQNMRDQLTCPHYDVNFGQQDITPADSLTLRLSKVRNPGVLTVHVSKVDIPQRVGKRDMTYEELQKHIVKKDLLTKQFYPRDLQPYELYDTTFVMGTFPIGIYLVEVMSDQPEMEPVYEIVHVSRVRLLTLSLPRGNQRMAVVDAITGYPLPNANIDVIENDRLTITLSTNSAGEVEWTRRRNNNSYNGFYGYEVYTDDDKASAPCPQRDYYYGGGSWKAKTGTELLGACYTDRAIYRPGQKVSLAILVMTNKQNRTFKPYRKEIEVEIDDPAYDEVVDTVLVPDEWGTAYIQFQIPENTPLGEYEVEVMVDDDDVTTYSFRVEEYKRPTFDVELAPLRKEDVHADEVVVHGTAKSLSGAPVSGATVVVDVSRTLSARRWIEQYREEPVVADTIFADEKGAFQIHVPMAVPDAGLTAADSLKAKWVFDITATVTDKAGETHAKSSKVNLGVMPFALSVPSLHTYVEAGKTIQVRPVLVDRWGLPVDREVKVWNDQSADTLLHQANTPLSIPITGTLASPGLHHLYVKYADVVVESELKVVDFTAKRLGVFARDFFAQSATVFPSDGGKVNIQFGTSLDSVYVLYSILAEDMVIESGAFELSDAIQNRSFAYKRSYGKGLTLSYVFMKDGQVTTHGATIYAPIPEKSLKLEWATFRDKLQPGQSETWTLRVRNANGSPAKAQLLSTLYDASLDPIVRHRWSFNPLLHSYLYQRDWNYNHKSLSATSLSYAEMKTTFPLSLNVFDDKLMRLKGDSTVLQRILANTRTAQGSLMQGALGRVSGIVRDEDGEPIIGASVMIKDSKKGTVTDINGYFTLPVTGGVKLNVNYVGYVSKVVNAFTGNYIVVTLEPDNMALNDVVVVGYGTSRKSRMTGSTTMVLEGQIPGVAIRGAGAGGAMPLYVIDGVVIDDLSGIDMNAISSIEVLKDASATAIYGSRASSGVIVISTKGAPLENAALLLGEALDSLVPQPAPSVRENFEETAFFAPRLMADENGEFVIRFTLPESVTSWRFMGLAHDKEMNYALTEALAVAQKEVMVQPNMPRFLRVGDQSTFTARVANLSDNVKEGVAELTLSDMATGEVVWTGKQPFRIDAQTTEGVDFTVPPFDTTAALVSRTIVHGDGFSDGEQQFIPVVPAREWITSSHPFVMKGRQKLELPLAKLLPVDASQRKLVFEYTAHPEWLVINALPLLSATTDDDAISQAAVYYANQLGRMVMEGSPDIRQAVTTWQNDTTLNSPLHSALQKNASLKEIMLSESPWMVDADSENAMKRRLAKFFDGRTMDRDGGKALDQLSTLQNGDGGWAWCKGMNSSIYTTVTVMEMLARVNLLKPSKKVDTMLNKGLAFLRSKADNEVKKMHEATEKGVKVEPQEWMLHYLYISALVSPKDHKDNKETHQYLLSFLEQRKVDLSIYGKAACAVVMAREGHEERAREYLRSLKEYAVTSEEMGMFFDTPKALLSWRNYEIPTVAMAIEATQLLTPEDTVSVRLMRQWLLMQKRTQLWESNVATVDAVHALFSDAKPSFIPYSPSDLSLTVDGNPIPIDGATAGVGYVKTEIDEGKLEQFCLEKNTDQMAWGAVYGQSLQPVSVVANDAKGITVKRELVLPDRPLRVGDKIKVRITLVTDRNYDFVQVCDRRPACLEPVNPLSHYFWGYYSAKRDNTTTYCFDGLAKGTTVLEEEYYIDREGEYTSGTCVAQCAYAPEFKGIVGAYTLKVSR